MAITEKRKDTMMEYAKKNLKRVPLDVQKEHYERIKTHADRHGETVNGFIKRAVDSQMARDSTDGTQDAVGQPAGVGVVSLPANTFRTVHEAAQASGETPLQFISRAVDAQFQEDARARLNEDRQDQTTADLVFEIEDTARLVTSTLWCNVFYNDKLYKKPKDAQKVRDALVECRQRISAMLDNLIEKIGAHGDAHK